MVGEKAKELGLRIAEALSLRRNQAPVPGVGDQITVTGKGNKSRMVPVLRQVAKLIAEKTGEGYVEKPAVG